MVEPAQGETAPVKGRDLRPWGAPIGAAIGLVVLACVFVALAAAGAISHASAWYVVGAGVAYLVASLATVLVLRRRRKRL